MRESGASQSVIVSGESGAGKTETVKLLLTHVAELSTGGKSGRDGSAIQVKPQFSMAAKLTEPLITLPRWPCAGDGGCHCPGELRERQYCAE
jgi:hypothetical protein